MYRGNQMKKSTPNIKVLKEILKFIIQHPEHWDQEIWHCGSSHCVAGFIELHQLRKPWETFVVFTDDTANIYDIQDLETQVEKDLPILVLDSNPSTLESRAAQYIGLDLQSSWRLFDPNNTLEDLIRIIRLLEEKYSAYLPD